MVSTRSSTNLAAQLIIHCLSFLWVEPENRARPEQSPVEEVEAEEEREEGEDDAPKPSPGF